MEQWKKPITGIVVDTTAELCALMHLTPDDLKSKDEIGLKDAFFQGASRLNIHIRLRTYFQYNTGGELEQWQAILIPYYGVSFAPVGLDKVSHPVGVAFASPIVFPLPNDLNWDVSLPDGDWWKKDISLHWLWRPIGL